MVQRLAEPDLQLRVTTAELRDLGKIDRFGAMLARMVDPQNAPDQPLDLMFVHRTSLLR